MNRKYTLTVLASVALTGCGGGGSSGSNVVDGPVGEFAATLGNAAAESMQRAIASGHSGGGAGGLSLPAVAGASTRAITTPGSSTTYGTCGGESVATFVLTQPDVGLYPEYWEGLTQYNNFCTDLPNGQTFTLNGTDAGSIATLAEDNVITENRYDLYYISSDPAIGVVYHNHVFRCQNEDCTVSVEYEDESGNPFMLTAISVSGNNSSGYSATATLTDESAVAYSLRARGVTFCPVQNGQPLRLQTGSVTAQVPGGSSISVTFPNCNEMVVTYQGVAERIAQ